MKHAKWGHELTASVNATRLLFRDQFAHVDFCSESRNTALNMERVEKDLEQVKKENKGLTAKLKTLNPSLAGAE